MTTTTAETYHDYPIMTDKAKGLVCDIKILNEIERQLDYAEETKSKTLFMRYDIRFPEGYDHADNGVFREFQSKFMKNLSRQGLKPQYIAVREQSREKHQHYHVALLRPRASITTSKQQKDYGIPLSAYRQEKTVMVL